MGMKIYLIGYAAIPYFYGEHIVETIYVLTAFINLNTAIVLSWQALLMKRIAGLSLPGPKNSIPNTRLH